MAVKTSKKTFPVGYKLMFVMFFCSTKGLFLFILQFFFIFEHTCRFYEFILFPCQIIKLLTIPNEDRHSRKNAQRWEKAYLDLFIILVTKFLLFGLRHSYLAKFKCIFWFYLSLSFFVLCHTAHNNKTKMLLKDVPLNLNKEFSS